MVALSVPRHIVSELYAHCAAAWPDEACAVLAGPEGGATATRAYLCTNIQNRLHQEDPVAHPRDARTAYLIDPADLFRITREVRDEALEMVAIVHSHADVGAYFSAEDQRQAAPEMTLSTAVFARGEGVTEELVRAQLKNGQLAGDPAADQVTARIPVYPELVYLVVDVTRSEAREFKSFAWDAGARTYVETRVDVTEDGQAEARP